MKRLVLLLLIFAFPAFATDNVIRITKGNDKSIPIAVVPFGGASSGIEDIVAADLYRSGLFSPLDKAYMLETPSLPEQVNWADWRSQGMDYMVTGRMDRSGGGWQAQFWLLDVIARKVILEKRVQHSDAKALRAVAHTISDHIFEALTGEPGAFNTRLAYVVRSPGRAGTPRYSLYIADADGENARPVLHSPDVILSPSWSPEGARLAYVSYEGGKPSIWIHDLRDNRRRQVTRAPGINGAPAWSPDGRSLAVVLSYGKNPDIYRLDLGTERLQRLTQHWSIDTEPEWFPDGKRIVFTSDRSGNPNLFTIDLPSGKISRLTYEGDYNARPRVVMNGRRVAMLHRPEGQRQFRLAIQDMDSNRLRVLQGTQLDESPAMAPNGAMAVYATDINGVTRLMVSSSNGLVIQAMPAPGGDIREPAWSPLARNNKYNSL